MVYVQGIDFISETEECRRLARNVVDADFDDAQITAWQYYNYSQIRTITHKDDWDSNDREFGLLKGLETKLTAADIIEHYGDINTTSLWQAMRESALSVLNVTAAQIGDSNPAIDEVIDVVVNDYVSYPASLQDNEDTTPYRSTNISV